MKGRYWVIFISLILVSLFLVSCNTNQTSTLPPVQQSPNAPVPTTSTQMALATDTSVPAVAATEGKEPTAAETKEQPAEVARPSNPGGTGQAVSLTGNPANGQATFNQICSACHGPNGTKGVANPGSNDGEVPALNPIDPTIANADPKIFAQNVDLFVEHGSTPEGPNPTIKMPSFGDSKTLTPQQIADVISYVISLNASAAQAPVGTPGTLPPNPPAGSPVPGNTEAATEPAVAETQEQPSDVARPSNPGAPGQAIMLTGNAANGQALFTQICSACHGPNGTKGIANPGSNDGSVPVLNPIDPTIANPDPKIFATNVDLFVEHGSTPEGPNPTLKMPSFGDSQTLTPQQIADVIAYVISLNTKK